MVAGIITLGFIYGAHFTETFAAFMAVPKGHIEGDSLWFLPTGNLPADYVPGDALRRPCRGSAITGRYSKATALGVAAGPEDVVKATQLAGKSTWEPFYFAVVRGLIYRYLPPFPYQWCAALYLSVAIPWAKRPICGD